MRNTRTHRLPYAVCLLAVLATALLLVLRNGPHGARSAQSRPAAETLAAQAPAADDNPPAGGGPGDILGYRFESVRAISIEAAEHGEVRLPAIDLRIALAGRLVVKTYPTTGGCALLGMEVSDVAVRVTGGEVSDREGSIHEAMDGEVLVAFDASGAVARLVFPEGMSAGGRMEWKQLLTWWNLTLPPGAEATGWDADELDLSGRYVAHYKRLSPGGGTPLEMVRVKERYLESPESLRAGRITKVEGSVRWVLDPLPQVIEGDERVDAVLEATGQRAFSESSLRCVRESCEHGVSLRAPTARGIASGLGEMEVARPTPEQARDGALALLVQLDALKRAQRIRSEEHHLALVALVRLLAVSPEALAPVLDVLDGAGCSGTDAAVLGTALASAGTPAAQAALAQRLGQPGRPLGQRQALVTALVHIEQPVEELDDALLRLRAAEPEMAGPALLALGTLGNRVRESDPERFARLSALTQAELEQSRDPSERATALDALGNLGPAAVSDPMRRSLESDDADVRMSGLRALRRVPGAEADRLVVRTLQEDSLAPVRETALLVLGERIRSGLADLSPVGIDVHQILETVVADDAAEAVRKLATRLLARLPESDA